MNLELTTQPEKRNREEYFGKCKRVGWNVNLSPKIVKFIRKQYPRQEIIFNENGMQWNIYVVKEEYNEGVK